MNVPMNVPMNGRDNKKSSLNDKYRPEQFNDITLYNSIKTFLVNSILTQKISNAYLFYGERGVGKTTLARIFAKSLNCRNRNNSCEPCGVCVSCESFKNRNHSDVFEIDAASNNSVDSVRDLIEGAKYLPLQSDYKIYILDEVHMFSTSAFNSLLKILEEPPNYVVFILSTTEFQKIPKTIVSRCKLLNLKSLTIEEISERLSSISEKENINIDKNSLYTIAHVAKGSMRDAISLLDQSAIMTDDSISFVELQKILGIDNSEILKEFMTHILNRDLDKMLILLNSLENSSTSISLLFEQILDILLLMMIIKAKQKKDFHHIELYGLPEDLIYKMAGSYEYSTLDRINKLFVDGCDILKKSVYSDDISVLRLTVVRVCMEEMNEIKLNIPTDIPTEIQGTMRNSIENRESEIVKSDKSNKSNKSNKSEKLVENSSVKTEKKTFDHKDLLRLLQDEDLIRVARDNEDLFNYFKFEIRESKKLPSRYLQTFVRTLRGATGNIWRIILNDEASSAEKKNMYEEKKNKPYEDVKKDFIVNSKIMENLRKNFEINTDNIKVSK